ncbi:hypothetical protein Glove_52g20 [Diversispora epigaea]|uniref:Uncharacterized protein n=1 Tax=Diversispora epigaea TaxID=1348612 RepID=A0A397JFF6_9GLOM|nr:hypothetical protein Glove_52g20 [Diversispora epigaea]
MLLSITLTALSAVSASLMIPIFKYFEYKNQKKHQNENANQHLDESNIEPNIEESNIQSTEETLVTCDTQCTVANTSVITLGVHGECENRNDGGANATSKTEMLPPLSKLEISSNFNEEERFNNLDNKIDEILKRVEVMRKYHEQRRQKNQQK